MNENYLAKWLNNELSEAELEAFKQSAEYASYQKIVEESNKLQPPQFEQNKIWQAVQQRTYQKETKVIRLNPFTKIMRYAAVVALVVTGSYFLFNAGTKTFETQLAQQAEVILPDNSEIVLNAASKISFNEKRWDSQRDVSLEGEAFFKVAKGKKFTVTTDAGTVAVLGTQFNVEQREGFFEVSCYEGLVSVTHNGVEHRLPAGNSFMVVNGTIQLGEEPKNGQPSWMVSESSFKSIPLRFVIAEFERQFNIQVTTENVDTEQLFTGTFSNTDLNLALKSISTPTKIRYTLDEDKVLFYVENTP